MNKHIRRVRTVRARFKVGQHVCISMEKMKFEKGAEKNYIREIFRNNKVNKRTPRPVYELGDLNKTAIDGQFYQEELTPVCITKQIIK